MLVFFVIGVVGQAVLFSVCLYYFYLFKQMNIQAKTSKNQCSAFSILQLPLRSTLVEVPSPLPDYSLLFQNDKKNCIEAYSVLIQKTKLFQNLQIYEWRHKTEFPISKIHYVKIKQNYHFESQNVELIVYVEHCPWRLNSIKKQLSFSQTLFLLKESIFGFQRLFKKFGPFYVTQKMIGINQKGQCRVWMQENYANNFCLKQLKTQENMVRTICQILQKRCENSKTIEKFFSKLNQVKSFLSVLRQIDNFSGNNRIYVPYRYHPEVSLESNRTKQSIKQQNRNQFTSAKNFRYSVTSSRKHNRSLCQKQSIQIQKSKSNKSIEIKKIKSQDNIGMTNNMKKSDGQTTYTRNIKDVKGSNMFQFCNTPKDVNTSSEAHNNSVNSREKKDIGDCSFAVQLERTYGKNDKKDKKDLYYSEAAINPEDGSENKKQNRSFNSKRLQSQFQQPTIHTKNISRRGPSHSYLEQFNSILDIDKQVLSARRRPKKTQDEDSNIEKLRSSHTQSVMKINGWKSFTGLLQQPEQLNESFQEGQEENAFVKEIKLQKLESLGRRGPAMSILPEQIQDLI